VSADLKTVWAAPSTDARLKKRIIRTVIHEVIADIDPEAAEIVLVVHWIGGVHSEMRLPRRRRGQRNSTSADVIAAVRQLALIANDDLIAGILNRNGLVTSNGNRWTRERVTSLRSHQGTVNQSAGTERYGQEQLKEILLPDSFQPVGTVSQKKVARYGGCAIRSRPHRRRIVSIIVIALALPKTAAKKRSPRANARPKPSLRAGKVRSTPAGLAPFPHCFRLESREGSAPTRRATGRDWATTRRARGAS